MTRGPLNREPADVSEADVAFFFTIGLQQAFANQGIIVFADG
jgi:hypothetical protein